MINVIVTGFDGVLAVTLTSITDLFAMSGVTWSRIQQQPASQLFNVKIASQDGGVIQCLNGIKIHAELSFAEVKTADLILVPTIGAHIPQVLSENAALIEFLKDQYANDAVIAGNCTGNFFLAEAGLLDHKCATTHWGFQTFFSERYPRVDLRVDQLITRQDNIYCAGGGLSVFDLCIHLIERFCGFEIAIQTAKSFVIDYRRESQLSYSILRISKAHQDELVKHVQQWMETHFSEQFTLEEVSGFFSTTERTLIRRFKAALNMPPNQYLQCIRIEAAQKRLEETSLSIEVIMQSVGYTDLSSFRRLFHKKTGLTPHEYRRRFSRRL